MWSLIPVSASKVLDLEIWREQLCPRDKNCNRTEGTYYTKGRKTRSLGGEAAAVDARRVPRKKRSKKQGGKGKTCSTECRDPECSKER